MINYVGTAEGNWPSWSLDWAWMLSAWSGATVILSPTAAAIAAYLVIKQLPPDVRQVTTPLRRHARPMFDVAAAVWLQAALVQVITLALGVAACAGAGANPVGLTLPGQVLTGPAALMAAITAGVVLGMIFSGPWTVPAVAIGMFLSHQVFYWKGYPELFTVESATVAMTEARPMQSHLFATASMNLAAALGCLGLIAVWTSARGVRSRTAIGVAAVGLLTAFLIFLPWFVADNHRTYEYFS